MRTTAFAALLLLTAASCSSPNAKTNTEPHSTANSTPAPTTPPPNEKPETAQPSRSGPLTIEIPTAPTPNPNENGASTRPTEPQHTNENLHTEPQPTEPLPQPNPPPANSPPLEIAVYVGSVITNVSPDQRFNPDTIAAYLVDTLADQYRTTTATPRRSLTSRSVLVDSWTIEDTATSQQVQTIAVFERTRTTNLRPDPGFDFVYIQTVLILTTDRGWIIADLRLSTR